MGECYGGDIQSRSKRIQVIDHAYLSAYDRMDKKQQEVLQLIPVGKSNKEMSRRMYATYSPSTMSAAAPSLSAPFLRISPTHREKPVITAFRRPLTLKYEGLFGVKSYFRAMTAAPSFPIVI